MKISAAGFSNINTQINRTNSFKGLWGKTTRVTDFDQVLGLPKVHDTYYYYPYYNETPEQVRRVVEDNTFADIVNNAKDGTKYIINECKVCQRLPFDEKVYNTYSELTPADSVSINLRRLHCYIADKFTDRSYGPEQPSALNDVVTRKILEMNA